jgi:hypothetical protein
VNAGDEPESAAPNARAILEALARHHVDYLLIGGFAVNAHGYPRLTRDVDILVRPDEDNYARLAQAITDLDPDWRLPGNRDPQDIDRVDWWFGDFARFHTPEGSLDTHRRLEGVRAGYQELDRRAITAEITALRVRVIGYDDLIRIKRAAGRPQDLADIAALEDARRPPDADKST